VNADPYSALVEAVAARVLEHLGAREAPTQHPEYLTVSEAAEVIRAKPQRSNDLVSAGRLSRVKHGGRLLVRRDELEAYLTGDLERSA